MSYSHRIDTQRSRTLLCYNIPKSGGSAQKTYELTQDEIWVLLGQKLAGIAGIGAEEIRWEEKVEYLERGVSMFRGFAILPKLGHAAKINATYKAVNRFDMTCLSAVRVTKDNMSYCHAQFSYKFPTYVSTSMLYDLMSGIGRVHQVDFGVLPKNANHVQGLVKFVSSAVASTAHQSDLTEWIDPRGFRSCVTLNAAQAEKLLDELNGRGIRHHDVSHETLLRTEDEPGYLYFRVFSDDDVATLKQWRVEGKEVVESVKVFDRDRVKSEYVTPEGSLKQEFEDVPSTALFQQLCQCRPPYSTTSRTPPNNPGTSNMVIADGSAEARERTGTEPHGEALGKKRKRHKKGRNMIDESVAAEKMAQKGGEARSGVQGRSDEEQNTMEGIDIGSSGIDFEGGKNDDVKQQAGEALTAAEAARPAVLTGRHHRWNLAQQAQKRLAQAEGNLPGDPLHPSPKLGHEHLPDNPRRILTTQRTPAQTRRAHKHWRYAQPRTAEGYEPAVDDLEGENRGRSGVEGGSEAAELLGGQRIRYRGEPDGWKAGSTARRKP